MYTVKRSKHMKFLGGNSTSTFGASTNNTFGSSNNSGNLFGNKTQTSSSGLFGNNSTTNTFGGSNAFGNNAGNNEGTQLKFEVRFKNFMWML